MAEPLIKPRDPDAPVVWTPFPGSQTHLLQCPFWEILIEGERGSSKSEGCLMRFLRYVDCGFGRDWRGLWLRRTYKELAEIIHKSEKLIPRIFPRAKFRRSPGGAEGYTWTFPDGEWLMFAQALTEDDVGDFLGWELPTVVWEEKTQWPNDSLYEALKGCSRSSNPEVAKRKQYLSNTNAWGPGWAWVKAYWVDPAPAYQPIPTLEWEGENGEKQIEYRVRIPSFLHENLALRGDPRYRAQLEAISDPEKRKAWIGGEERWNLTVAGGVVGDIWREATHVVKPFNVPYSWRVERSYDHGSSHPFDVGWWAISDGTGEVKLESSNGGGLLYQGPIPKGSRVLVGEWYGWNGNPNEGLRMRAVEIAEGLKNRELAMRRGYLRAFERVEAGPADTEIFASAPGEQSVASRMSDAGIEWKRANKAPGSRIQGAEAIREMLAAAAEYDQENPWLLVFDTPGTREGFIRTVPMLPRDAKNPDDADTEGEDHPWDMARYEVLPRRAEIQRGSR